MYLLRQMQLLRAVAFSLLTPAKSAHQAVQPAGDGRLCQHVLRRFRDSLPLPQCFGSQFQRPSDRDRAPAQVGQWRAIDHALSAAQRQAWAQIS